MNFRLNQAILSLQKRRDQLNKQIDSMDSYSISRKGAMTNRKAVEHRDVELAMVMLKLTGKSY